MSIPLCKDDILIWLQIMEKDPLQPNGPPQTTLVEIGPRFVLTPIRIFEGAFSGATVFSNPGICPATVQTVSDIVVEFISPAAVRSAIRKEQGKRYNNRKDAEEEQAKRKEARKLDEDELAVSKVFA